MATVETIISLTLSTEEAQALFDALACIDSEFADRLFLILEGVVENYIPDTNDINGDLTFKD